MLSGQEVSDSWQRIAREVAERCAPAGLDLVRAFRVDAYDREVDEGHRLPDLGRSDALGLVVANSRALWAPFVAALRAEPARVDAASPLDEYAAEAIVHALRPLGARWEVRFAHEAPPRRVAMQRLAHVSGLAWLSPSHLAVHPRFGPWIGLRAAVVIDVEGPAETAPLPRNPCPDCERDCLPPARAALAAESPAATTAAGWLRWLAVRDACPLGREHRYGEDQIRYHYTKDRDVLRRCAGLAG